MNKMFFLALIILSFSIGCNQSEDKPAENDKYLSKKEGPTENQQINETTNNKTEKERTILAKVNGVPIYEDQLNGKNLEQLINEEVFYQDGLRRGIDKKLEDRLNNFKKSLVTQYLRKNIMDENPQKPITKEDVEIYYNDNIDKYTRITAEEINFKQKNNAEKIEKMISDGESLVSIKEQLNNPNIVYQQKVPLDDTVEKYFKTKEVGEVSEIIEKPDGTYSILKISNIHVVPFNHVAPSIKYTLKVKESHKTIDNYIQNLKEQDDIVVEYE